MNKFDKALQPGSGFYVGLVVTLVVFFTMLAFIEPEHRYFSMLLVTIGVGALARELKLFLNAQGL
mgnify:CR=1 FL=1